MTDERWEQVTNLIEKQFKIEEHEVEDLDPGKCEFYIFNCPLGQIKLERMSRPKRLGSKMHTSTRIGDQGREEILYSDTEMVSFVKAYKWNEVETDWQVIDAEQFL